jgi:hypothetical protein
MTKNVSFDKDLSKKFQDTIDSTDFKNALDHLVQFSKIKNPQISSAWVKDKLRASEAHKQAFEYFYKKNPNPEANIAKILEDSINKIGFGLVVYSIAKGASAAKA